MEKSKKIKIVGYVVIIFVFIGLSEYVGYEFGTYSSDQNCLKNSVQEEENDESVIENDSVSSNNTTSSEQGVINNTNIIYNQNVSQEEIEQILKILGIDSMTTENRSNSCLNYYLGSENYSENARNIISYYKDAYQNDLLTLPSDEVYNSDECGMGAADCFQIAKEDAEYLFQLYHFKGNIEDYFKTSSKLNESYLFFYNHAYGQCEYNITHTITSEYVDSDNIKISDSQIIRKYLSNTNDLESTTTKEVIYYFVKENNGVYLSKVIVK